MKSLLIHDVSTLNLKYLPLIADIVNGDIDDDEDNEDIFKAAAWFIQSLATEHYDISTDEEIREVTRFIALAKDLIDQLKKQLPAS